MLPNTDLDINIFDPSLSRILEEIANDLDLSHKWRDLVAVAGDDSKLFALNPHRVEECAQQLHKIQGSSTMHLFKMYSVAEPLCLVHNPEATALVDEGQTLILPCSATGFPYPRYVWFRGEVQVSESTEKGDLKLECVRRDQAGKYVCRVHNNEVLRGRDELKWSSICEVSVKPSPIARACRDDMPMLATSPMPMTATTGMHGMGASSLIITQHPQSANAKMMQDVCLMCYTQGDPNIIYEWLKNGQVIPGHHGSELHLTKVTLLDSGKYQCVVKGRQDIIRSREAYVNVTPRIQILDKLQPEIYDEPKNTATEVGGSAFFRVQAHGQPLVYQWFHNGKAMAGENHSELLVEVKSVDKKGTYQCLVENDHGRVTSRQATLEVQQNIRCHTAQDKVALLIGNSSHRSQQQLAGVVYDIAEATEIFRNLGFKVISLLDLTLDEMHIALKLFCSLLGSGVYAVFYFAGHGFAHQGQHYCIPWDMTHGSIQLKDCLCVEYVEAEVQKCKPSLWFMMLDICRKDNCCNHYPEREEKRYQPKVNANTVVWFAASYTQKAFEEPANVATQQPRGRFSRHVLRVLSRNEPLVKLFTDFLDEFRKDPYPQDTYPQDPEMRTNLRERICLTDPINFAGHTEEMNERSIRYESGWHVPQERNVCISEFGVKLRLRFKAYMSNVMDIHIDWVEQGQCDNLTVNIERSEKLATLTIENLAQTQGVIRIKNLQRLETETLAADFIVNLEFKAREPVCVPTSFLLDLGRPAISNLGIWKCLSNMENTPHKQATQQEEEADSSVNTNESDV